MNRARVLGGAILAASVACNAYLLVRRDARASPVAATGSARVPTQVPGQTIVARTVPPEVVALERGQLERRLAEAEARLEPMLPAAEKFERGERSPEHEMRLQPYFDELFADEPGYELECRGRICKLDSEAAAIDWRRHIQTSLDAHGRFEVAQIGGSAYLIASDKPEEGAGMRLALGIFASLAMSPHAEACRKEHPEPGVVELALRFDPASRKVSVVATGSLAERPGGRCLRDVLERIVATTAVPADVTRLPERPFAVRLP
jgi:hypothetical protein